MKLRDLRRRQKTFWITRNPSQLAPRWRKPKIVPLMWDWSGFDWGTLSSTEYYLIARRK